MELEKLLLLIIMVLFTMFVGLACILSEISRNLKDIKNSIDNLNKTINDREKENAEDKR